MPVLHSGRRGFGRVRVLVYLTDGLCRARVDRVDYADHDRVGCGGGRRRVRLAPCNPDSTDERTAAHLASIGVEVRARAGMSAGELDESLAWLVSEPADALCDMGGDLIVAAAGAGHRPVGALEATTTGLHRVDGLEIPFPVLDWNGIALKDLIHNRHHVGVETWPAFTAITGLALYGREVVVVGFGPVGQGVAARARDLGAVVTVVDLDPVRLVQAQHDACRVLPSWTSPSPQQA